MSWYPHSCPVCLGDLYDDVQETDGVKCMMCARSFIAADVLAVRRATRRLAEQRAPAWIADRAS